MSTYEPGTVAEIRWPMTSGAERALFDGRMWTTESGIVLNNPTDVRPLVVLDPQAAYWPFVHTDPQRLRSYAEQLEARFFGAALLIQQVAEQIEAQTKPPRIPEPGLYGVVEAGAGRIPVRRWVHHEEGWWVADTGDRLMWGDLEDPTLVREGVQS